MKSGRRVLVSKPILPDKLDQDELRKLAAVHTKRPIGESYKDSPSTKALFTTAKRTKLPRDWKKALRSRKDGILRWREEKVAKAAEGDWGALKECKVNTREGWESALSENLQPHDAHSVLHKHYESIFDHQETIEPLSCKPPASNDITEHELKFALSSGKTGKSVGVDNVSLELIRALADVEGGVQLLLDWFNSILHTGILPSDWLSSLMVLLPKVSMPKQARDTRPIAIGCAAEKIFCRVILERTKPHCSVRRPWQCSAPGRQSTDYLHAVHRLMETEREWQCGLAVI